MGQERAGAGDDGDVEAEEQPSQRRRGSQEDEVSEIDFAFRDTSHGHSIVLALQAHFTG